MVKQTVARCSLPQTEENHARAARTHITHMRQIYTGLGTFMLFVIWTNEAQYSKSFCYIPLLITLAAVAAATRHLSLTLSPHFCGFAIPLSTDTGHDKCVRLCLHI